MIDQTTNITHTHKKKKENQTCSIKWPCGEALSAWIERKKAKSVGLRRKDRDFCWALTWSISFFHWPKKGPKNDFLVADTQLYKRLCPSELKTRKTRIYDVAVGIVCE